MALELSRSETGSSLEDEERRLAAERRAMRALEALLGQVTANATDATVELAEDDDVVDIREDPLTGEVDETAWVSVAEAATRAGVSTSTVRQWYRSGHLATQRRDGERGGFLVPLADVVRLASAADDAGDVVEDSVIDINASYWAAETEAARAAAAVAQADADEARAETRRLAADLEEARAQIETAREQLRAARSDAAKAEKAVAEVEHEIMFLRSQLKEANDDLREYRTRNAALEAKLQATERAATFGTVTSTDWVEEVDHGYRGPVRPQDPFLNRYDDVVPADGAFAAAQYDVPQYDVVQDEPPTGGDATEAYEAPSEGAIDPMEILAMGLPPVVYGESADDLLPEPEAKPKGRRRR